jgi:glutamine amidotransferase
MCLIIYKPENAKFDPVIMSNAWRMNDDGAGFMAWDGRKKLIVKRGFFSLKELTDAIKPHQEQRCAVHFRWATHGEKNAANCHPFKVTKRLGMMHNGILDNIELSNPKFSDTWHFARICANTLRKFPDFWKTSSKKEKLEKMIGKGNKLVFMDNNGDVQIYNEKQGTWLDGCWYSNTLFTFGSYRGMAKAKERIESISRGVYISPYSLSPYEVDEGEDWYSCNNCYCDFKKEDNPPVSCGEFMFCQKCYSEVGEYFPDHYCNDMRPFDERLDETKVEWY